MLTEIIITNLHKLVEPRGAVAASCSALSGCRLVRATAVSATVRTTAVSVRVATMAVRMMMPIIGGHAAVSGAFAPGVITKADDRNDRECRECDDNYDGFHLWLATGPIAGRNTAARFRMPQAIHSRPPRG